MRRGTRIRLLIKPAGEAHSNKYGQLGAHCLIIEVETHRLDKLVPASRIFDRTDYLQGRILFAQVMRIHKELRITDSVSALAIEGLVLEMLAELTRRSRGFRGPVLRQRRRQPKKSTILTCCLDQGQAKKYYDAEYTNARESYYTEDESIDGQWFGKLAKEWGLEGRR